MMNLLGPRSVPPVAVEPGHVDRNGLEVLGRRRCLDLLRQTSVARIGVTVHALPAILPVNIVLVEPADGEPVIAIRTVEGSKLDAALRDTVVAVEADHVDPVDHCGWSVLVQGVASLVAPQDEAEVLHGAQVRAWASPHTSHLIVVSTDVVTGRRLDPGFRPDAPVEAW